MGKERFLGQKAQGLIRIGGTTILDGETATIGGKVYEFDTPDGVAAGHVAVSIASGTAAGIAAALIAAINANKPTPGITAVVDPLDTAKIRLIADARGTAGNMAISDTVADGPSLTHHDLINGEAGGTQTEARGDYTVLADDLAGTKSVVVDTGLTSPRFVLAQVRRAGVLVAFDGALTISGSKLCWADAGSVHLAAGDVITWLCWE